MNNTAEDLDGRIDQWLETRTARRDDCLVWTGHWNETYKYPVAMFDGVHVNVRRTIYNERVSLLGVKETTFPTCGEIRCVNEDHLDARPMRSSMAAAVVANAARYRRPVTSEAA